MPELMTDVRYIKGIGEQRAKALAKLGILTLRDLVSFFPRAYEDRTAFSTVAAAPIDGIVCLRAMVAGEPRLSRVRKGMELVKLRAVDETGAIDVTFFNQTYMKDRLIPGDTYIFYGKIGGVPTRKTMINPVCEREDAAGDSTGRIVPIYRLTAGISQKMLHAAVRQGLSACGELLPEYLPENVRLSHKLAQARYAYENMHYPRDMEALLTARRRLIFEELFLLACALTSVRGGRRDAEGQCFTELDMEEFFSTLPFAPTGAQRRAVGQAAANMCSGAPMNRLIQGDVGSGKTLVAAACVWLAWKNGRQSAFMAPTEILAEQHFSTFSGFLEPFGIRVERLTGSMTARQKREVWMGLASGDVDLVVGTHALLSNEVEFSALGLVVADEQHRFGVEQRAALSAKGARPHVLIMSATPIPRTLALMIYGDLDVSVIDELPPGRQKVDTFAVGENYRPRINAFIRKLAGEGRQVFVVCPMIEENETLPPDVKSAEEHAVTLASALPELRVACIHGKLKPKLKDELMAAFARGEYDVLVSTTVIEVGVDVPNAALMVIENADRFGLSQLHQLRGRVGRGEHKSYCILVSSADGEEAKARLQVMCATNDGFKISEEDLRLRGPGDFFGARQHGLPEMHVANLLTDMDVLTQAQTAARELLEQDPELKNPENAALKARVAELLEQAAGRLN